MSIFVSHKHISHGKRFLTVFFEFDGFQNADHMRISQLQISVTLQRM